MIDETKSSGYKQAVSRLAALVVAVVVLATPAAASSDNWWFKTPGGAAYCGVDRGWVCMRPEDGFWLRFTGVYPQRGGDVRKGESDRYLDYRGPAPRILRFGEVFYTSDAQIVSCWSRRQGVTCKLYEGLSFWLGRDRGYRIFWDAPGFPPNVLPLFRTGHGIYCGIDQETLVPEYPTLDCWNPADGLVIGIGYPGRRASHRHSEKAIDFRPRGFRKLSWGDTFEWRCRRVTTFLAEKCSPAEGEPVFTCTNTRAQLTCRNRNGHGFWVNARSFYTL
jgi:hypothetical protein